MGNRGITGRAWDQLKARVYAEETHCWLCHRYVDQTLPPRTRWSRSVDHIIPRNKGGDPLDRANCRLAHLACNGRRSDTRVITPPAGATHTW